MAWIIDWWDNIFAIVVAGLILWWLKILLILPKRVDDVEGRVKNVEGRVKNVEERVKNVEEKVDKVEKKVDILEIKVDGLAGEVANIHTEQKKQGSMLMSIRDALFSKGVMRPLSESESPKKITERGQELLDSLSIDEWLDSCELVKNSKKFKKMTDFEIFFKCLKWVDDHEEKKVVEIMYESDIPQEQCRELLALAIRDRILVNIGS